MPSTSADEIKMQQKIAGIIKGEIADKLMDILDKAPKATNTLYLDYNDFPSELAMILFETSDFSIFSNHFCNAFKMIAVEANEELFKKIDKHDLKLRVTNFQYNTDKDQYDEITKINELGSNYMKELLLVRGTVVMSTDNKIKMKKTVFRCNNCMVQVELDFNSSKSVSLNKCSACGQEEPYEMLAQNSSTIDSQVLTIEELSIDSVKNPISIDVILDGDLINKFEVGDIVVVSGNLRFNVFDESMVNQFKRKVSTNSYYNKMLSSLGGQNNGIDFDYMIEANHVSKIAEKSIKFHDLSEEEREKIESLKKNPHLIDILVKSFCPKIYGEEVKKEALLYQLVGGLGRSIYPDMDNRGEIHILLFGDASTGKTRLMLFAMQMASKTRYGVGKGVSQPGLTGGVDTLENKRVLTAGDAVMADMGLLVLDELSDVPDDAINALKEIMEKQTATITKIRHGTFRTRTAILAGSNPKHGGSYNPHKNFNENIGLGHALMTRFDLIFLFRDIPGIRDKPIATSILNSYKINPVNKDETDFVSKELLAKYIFLAKNSGIIPQLTPEAEEEITRFYDKLRGTNLNDIVDDMIKKISSADKTPDAHPVSFSSRQVESLIRLATARSRLRFSNVTDIMDVQAVINMMNEMLKTIGIDIETGKVDINAIFSTKTANQENKEGQFMELIEQLAAANNNAISKSYFKKRLLETSKWKGSTDKNIEDAIKGYERRNTINVLNDIISLTYE